MRKLAAVLTLGLAASACGNDATGPADDPNAVALEEMATLAYGFTEIGGAMDGRDFIARLSSLPAELALTSEQSGHIASLIAAFEAATAGDREALSALRHTAEAARRAGATSDEVRAILAGGAEIRARLQEAERALRTAVLGVLTPAQRAWLTGRTPREPRPCALTEAQSTEISALRSAFEQANATDIALVRSVHDRALAARQSGAPREEVAAILAEGRDAVQRLTAARAALHDAVLAVLTPEQRAAGCLR